MTRRTGVLFGLFLLTVLVLPLLATSASADGAPRATYFERVADAMARHGDGEGQAYLRSIANQPPTPPPHISDAARRAHPDLVEKYDFFRRRVTKAIRAPEHTPDNQWRVDRAEADLHLVYWELNQGRAASVSFALEWLLDASYALDHTIFKDGAEELPPPAVPPTAQIQADPPQIMYGDASTVSWRTTNATTALLNGEAVSLDGSRRVRPEATTVYTIQAQGPGGRASASTQVTVVYPTPTIRINVRPSEITRGECATLTWSSSNADHVTINGEDVALNGSREECPATSTTYDAVATGRGGTARASTALAVKIPPPARYRIHFDFDEWVIREDALDTLAKVASLMRQDPDMVMLVEGHCDAKGTVEYNNVLGAKRAQSVRDYFVGQFGIEPGRFRLVSKSELEPIAPNTHPDGSDNPEGRQWNRRAEFIEVR
jgi:outer membrane protein OmpA-like peptidoglycan-associated protein